MSNLNERQFGQQPEHTQAPKGTDPALHLLHQSGKMFKSENKRGPKGNTEHMLVAGHAHNNSGWW